MSHDSNPEIVAPDDANLEGQTELAREELDKIDNKKKTEVDEVITDKEVKGEETYAKIKDEETHAEVKDEAIHAEVAGEETHAKVVDEEPLPKIKDEEMHAEVVDEAKHEEVVDKETQVEIVNEEIHAGVVNEETRAEVVDEEIYAAVKGEEIPAEVIDEEIPAEVIDEETNAEAAARENGSEASGDDESKERQSVKEEGRKSVSYSDDAQEDSIKSGQEMRKGSMDLEDLAKIMKSDSDELSVKDMFSMTDLEPETTPETTPETKPESEKEDIEPRKKSFVSLTSVTRFPEIQSLEGDFHLLRDVESLKSFLSMVSIADTRSYRRSTKEVEDIVIDRHLYYEMHAMYTKQYESEKRKNNFLQTRLGDYYKRKRMYHVLLPDPKDQPEYQKKYEKLLEDIENLNDLSVREQIAFQSETDDLRNKCRFRSEELAAMFEKLQKAEKDASKELFGTESEGKATAEKFVERYLKRQRLQFGALSRMRLEYIKLRNNYIDKQEALNSLDNLGPNLHLIDYEQLKCDNRNLCDKLEEKELSLASLRRKCQNVMQILAHQREKATAIEVDIQSYNDRLESVMDEFADVREQLSTMKQERDDYRRGANKLKDQAGLLTRPKLLRDMESAIMEAEEGWAKLDEYKESFHAAAQELSMLRNRGNSTSTAFSDRKSVKIPGAVLSAVPKKRISFRMSIATNGPM